MHFCWGTSPDCVDRNGYLSPAILQACRYEVPYPIQSCVLGVSEIIAYCHKKKSLQKFQLPQVWGRLCFHWPLVSSNVTDAILKQDQQCGFLNCLLSHLKLLSCFLLFCPAHGRCFRSTCGPADNRTGSGGSSSWPGPSCFVSSPFMVGIHGPRWPAAPPRNRPHGRNGNYFSDVWVMSAVCVSGCCFCTNRPSTSRCDVIHTVTAAFRVFLSLRTARQLSLLAVAMALLYVSISGKQQTAAHSYIMHSCDQ